MATAREIKTRIESVKNIKKITETMEKISTAKIKQSTNRLISSRDYYISLIELINNLIPVLKEEGSIDHPLLKNRSEVKNVLIFAVTSNRGLCGGYNNSVNHHARNLYRTKKEEGKNVKIYVTGKKGAAFCKFNHIPVEKNIIDIDDKVSYEQILGLSNEFKDYYSLEQMDEIYFVYTKYYSASQQKAVVEKVLPFEFDGVGASDEKEDFRPLYTFEPNSETVLNHILPIALNVKLFNILLETNLSEHIARKIAMKQATDSAGDMIKDLSLEYNRARQAKITKELIEIMGAAKALQ